MTHCPANRRGSCFQVRFSIFQPVFSVASYSWHRCIRTRGKERHREYARCVQESRVQVSSLASAIRQPDRISRRCRPARRVPLAEANPDCRRDLAVLQALGDAPPCDDGLRRARGVPLYQRPRPAHHLRHHAALAHRRPVLLRRASRAPALPRRQGDHGDQVHGRLPVLAH